MIRFLIIVTGLIFTLNLAGQPVVPGTFSLNELLLESLASQNAGDDDYESLLNELEYLQKNPIDLNSCTQQDLERLLFLSDFQIKNFLEYRSEKGKLLSIFELQVIHGFSDDVIQLIIPFVAVNDEPLPGTLNLKDTGKGRHEVLFRTQRLLEKSGGYKKHDPITDDPHYPGSPWLFNAHYGYSLRNRVKAGITVEKDAGEQIFSGSNQGFDFTSAFIMLNDAGSIKSAVIGDYRLAFGQGLTLWSGTSPGKSSMPLSIVKRQDAIKTYTSNDENN
ncbi:helix-hairpin-helix domain-containing protein, partial [bacterium]